MINYVYRGEHKMSKLSKITKTNNGFFVHNNGQPLFIKQPNIMEVRVLYQAIMSNKQNIKAAFRKSK